MKKKILIIEESVYFRLRLRQILENMGHLVREVRGTHDFFWKSFLEEMQSGSFDLIILDTSDNQESWIRIAQYIRNKHPSVPLVTLGGEGKKEKIIQLSQLGISDYLLKPIDNTRFVERISQVLDRFGEKMLNEELDMTIFVRDEIERSVRSSRQLGMISLSLNDEALLRYQRQREAAQKLLRHIDRDFVLPGRIFVLLPLTDLQGTKQVEEKFVPEIGRLGVSVQVRKQMIYPDEFPSLMKLKKYDFDQITHRLMKLLLSNQRVPSDRLPDPSPS